MKLIHLSDLHIGKRVNEFSMLEDQDYILKKIINIIDAEKPTAVIIAGDVYDKSVPSAEAVQLFDDFLVTLSTKKIKIFVISGNHDSAERIAFGGRIMCESGVYMSPVYNKDIERVTLYDEVGDVNLYLLPFIKPAHVRAYFPDDDIASFNDAVKIAINQMNVDTSQRNILVTHQFVTGATTCDSEYLSVGGSDNIDVTIFDPFDYVALGHLHGPQKVSKETIRYCGTPLKYSFSECHHKKSVTVVEINKKDEVVVRTVPLKPKRDMREIKGTYMVVTSKSFYENTNTEDYLHITLTDEEDIPDAIGKLRAIYPNIMKLDYDNTRTQKGVTVTGVDDVDKKTPVALFSEFYGLQNNQPLTDEQKIFVEELIETIWEGQE